MPLSAQACGQQPTTREVTGFEVMHALRKGQAAIFQYGGGIMGEVRLIERRFNVYTT